MTGSSTGGGVASSSGSPGSRLRARGTLLGQTWLALHRARVELASEPLPPSSPFAVQLTVTGLEGAVTPTVVKSLIDGTVAAFQAHGDPSEMARRVGASLGVRTDEVAGVLSRRDRAVLGIRPRLLWRWRDVVQWNPGDDACLAGEVLAEAGGGGWSVGGRVTEIESA